MNKKYVKNPTTITKAPEVTTPVVENEVPAVETPTETVEVIVPVVEVEIPEVVKTEEVDPVPVFSQDGTSATFVEELTHDQTKATIVQEPVVVATVSATVAQPISGFSESHILVNLWIGTILDFYGYKSVKEVVKFHTETSGSAVDVTNSVILMSLISELAAVGATKEKIEKVKIRA